MTRYYLFQREGGSVIAVAVEALARQRIGDELGIPLVNGKAVPAIIANAFLREFGGEAVD